MFVLWRNVLRVSMLEGHHTKVVQLGPRYGFILFIVSEVMFLFALFQASSHSSLAPTVEIGAAGVFIERGKSRVASRLTDFLESEEDLSSDHPEHEGAALDVRSAAKERRKGPCSFSPCSNDALLARGATYLLHEGRKPVELDYDSSITLWRSPFSSWSIYVLP
ncbi:cytochrome c oxidase subunit 3 [Tanacetum coccineum]